MSDILDNEVVNNEVDNSEVTEPTGTEETPVDPPVEDNSTDETPTEPDPTEPVEKPVPICSRCAFCRIAKTQEEYNRLVNIKPEPKKPIRHLFCTHEETSVENMCVCLNVKNARRNYILDDYFFQPCRSVNFYGECRYFEELIIETLPEENVEPDVPTEPDNPETNETENGATDDTGENTSENTSEGTVEENTDNTTEGTTNENVEGTTEPVENPIEETKNE